MHGHHHKPMPAIATVMLMIQTHYTLLFRRVSAVSCCRIRVGDGDVSTARRKRFQREDWTALDVTLWPCPKPAQRPSKGSMRQGAHLASGAICNNL